MQKRTIIAIFAVYLLWMASDFVIHQILLAPLYEATASLWRPAGEMKVYLAQLVSLGISVCFVGIYAWLISDKSVLTGLRYGFLFGIASGLAMGYGSYCYMPIPHILAFAWFLGTLVQVVLAGWIVGRIITE